MLYTDANAYWEDKRKREEQKNSPAQRQLDADAEESADTKLSLLRDVRQLGVLSEFNASVCDYSLVTRKMKPEEKEAQRLEWFNFWQAYCFVVRLPIV